MISAGVPSFASGSTRSTARLFAIAGKVVTLFDGVGSLTARKRRLIPRGMADQVEEVEIFLHFLA
jgi:hypothetical protein